MSTVEGWKKESLSRVAQINMGQSPDSKYYSEEKNGLPFLQGCAEFTGRFPKNVLYCSQTKKVALAGSILFSVRAPVGKINVADQDYIIGRGLAAISGVDVDQTYLEHYLKYEASSFRNASQGSTFEAINSSELNKWPIEYPTSKPEQAKIAEILSTVDRAIEQTEALIAKQQRIKTGLMQDLLTRGIDEHGNLRTEQTHKFKDSPLGRIPMELDVRKLSELVDEDITYGIVQAGPNIENGVPYIRTGDMAGETININKLLRTSERIAKSYKRSTVYAEDIVFALRATVGKVLPVSKELEGANLTQGTAKISPMASVVPSFLLWALRTAMVRNQIRLHQKGTTFMEITLSDLRSIEIILPMNRDEQSLISDNLNKHDDLQGQYIHYCLKLRSLKTALMQDLLTGKKRVS